MVDEWIKFITQEWMSVKRSSPNIHNASPIAPSLCWVSSSSAHLSSKMHTHIQIKPPSPIFVVMMNPHIGLFTA